MINVLLQIFIIILHMSREKCGNPGFCEDSCIVLCVVMPISILRLIPI